MPIIHSLLRRLLSANLTPRWSIIARPAIVLPHHTLAEAAARDDLVILKRVRFIAVLAAVGVFIGYWGHGVMNYWEKWTQPGKVASRELEPGNEFYCPMDPQVVRSSYEPNGDVPKCPICGMPLSQRKKGQSVKLPEGITGRVQLSARNAFNWQASRPCQWSISR